MSSRLRNRHGNNTEPGQTATGDEVQQQQRQDSRSSRPSTPRPQHPGSNSLARAILASFLLSGILAVFLYVFLTEKPPATSQTSSSDNMPPTDPVQKKLGISFESAFSGGSVMIDLDGLVRVCSSCKGSGAAPGAMHFCTACQGTGERITRTQIFTGGPLIHIRQQCSRCQGTGKMITKLCPRCNGHRTSTVQQQVEVPIHAGARTGDIVRIVGLGNHLPDHSAGDLIFLLEIPAESGPFRLDGNNVAATIPIELRDALLGFRKSIRHVDEGVIVVDRLRSVTSPDTVVGIKGRGWPPSQDGQHPAGDLLVRFDIEYPQSIEADDIELLKRSFQ